MNSIDPGQQFILRRPYGGKDPDKFCLVEIGSRKYRHDPEQGRPADDIELLILDDRDELGNIIRVYDPPISMRTSPGAVLDERYYTPVAQARRVAA